MKLVINEPPKHDIPAKREGFKPWKNEYGEDYGDWSHLPEKLWHCTVCGIEWGVSIRKGKLSCIKEDPVSSTKKTMNQDSHIDKTTLLVLAAVLLLMFLLGATNVN